MTLDDIKQAIIEAGYDENEQIAYMRITGLDEHIEVERVPVLGLAITSD